MTYVVYSLYSESTRWNFASCLGLFYLEGLDLRWQMRKFVFLMRMMRTQGSEVWSGQPRARGIHWLQVSESPRPRLMRWGRASIVRCVEKETKSVTCIPSLMIVTLKCRKIKRRPFGVFPICSLLLTAESHVDTFVHEHAMHAHTNKTCRWILQRLDF